MTPGMSWLILILTISLMVNLSLLLSVLRAGRVQKENEDLKNDLDGLTRDFDNIRKANEDLQGGLNKLQKRIEEKERLSYWITPSGYIIRNTQVPN